MSTKISELNALAAPAHDDLLPIVDASAGETKKIAVANLLGILRAYKTADETVTNSDVLQTDDHLSVTLEAGHKYDFKIRLHVTASADGGMRVAIGGTATYTNIIGQVWAVSQDDAATAFARRITTADESRSIIGGEFFITIDGSVEVNAGGTFALRWAQDVSDPATETVKRGSTMILIEIP